MNKLKTTNTAFHVCPTDEKHRKQWLTNCKPNVHSNFNCARGRVCPAHHDCVDGQRNEQYIPLQKRLKSDALQNKHLPPKNSGPCPQLMEAAVASRAAKKQNIDTEKNLVNGILILQGNLSSKVKIPNSAQDTKFIKSPEHIPSAGASGCPMAMKGKMRYELVTTDWKPVKTEPAVVTSPTSDASATHTNGNSVSLGSPKSPKPVQSIKKCRLSTEESEKSGDAENDDDIRALEEEIIELQEYNAKVESEMIKLRTDITQMEQHIRMTERDNQSLTQKSHRMSEYYESLRNNFISLLDQVRLPNFDERPTHDNFDTYLNRLQSLCAESCREENKAILSSVKQALQDFPMHLTSGWLRS